MVCAIALVSTVSSMTKVRPLKFLQSPPALEVKASTATCALADGTSSAGNRCSVILCDNAQCAGLEYLSVILSLGQRFIARLCRPPPPVDMLWPPPHSASLHSNSVLPPLAAAAFW